MTTKDDDEDFVLQLKIRGFTNREVVRLVELKKKYDSGYWENDT